MQHQEIACNNWLLHCNNNGGCYCIAAFQDVRVFPEASWSLDLVTSVEHNVRLRSLLTIQLFVSWALRESVSRSFQHRHSHGHILGRSLAFSVAQR